MLDLFGNVRRCVLEPGVPCVSRAMWQDIYKRRLLTKSLFYTMLVGCWAVEENTHVYGGKVNSADNLQACQAACLNNARCNGVDWNQHAGQNCWLCGPWSRVKMVGLAKGITHYELNRNCAGKLFWLPRSVHVPVAKRTFRFNTIFVS